MQCGFSRNVIMVLRAQGVPNISHINILEDEAVRRYAKEYSYGREARSVSVSCARPLILSACLVRPTGVWRHVQVLADVPAGVR